MPDGLPHILGGKAKWDPESPEYKGTKSVLADLAPDLRARVDQAALAAYRALRVRDYGRVDMRVTGAGEVFVIEVNASCYLERESEYALAAQAAGMTHAKLVNRVVDCATERLGLKKV